MKPLPRFIVLLQFLFAASTAFGQVNIFRPEIIAQIPSPLTTTENQPITIELKNFIVIDGDPLPVYPSGFTLDVLSGRNYRRDNTTVIPDRNFTGRLTVPVTVNDGRFTSKKFEVQIVVNKAANVAPEIIGQDDLSTEEDKAFTLRLSHLQVTDPDDRYPGDFELIVNAGSNYTVSGTTITPEKNYTGDLQVSVAVNDGESSSAPYNLTLHVNPVNDAPIIIGQASLTTAQETAITIELSHLTVNDPDDKYPDEFSLKISSGNGYTVSGSSVKPVAGFSGMLNVKVSVHDGTVESNLFNMRVEVTAAPKNTPPTITGQKEISIVENSSLLILLSHLSVDDPDNEYPAGFGLKVFPGENYSMNGSTIYPVPNFKNNTLSIKVMVNDGTSDSAPYFLKVKVIPISSTPKIIGQKELSTLEETSRDISLTDLEVTDADNAGYPKGFSLTVMPGEPSVYTVAGNTITPAVDVYGFIDVLVKVSDGKNVSDPFNLSVLVEPVNDPPQITSFDTARLAYEPGKEPIYVFETIDLNDVDSDHLSMAEIGFRSPHFSQGNDELITTIDTLTNINAIYDPGGILFLVGYGTLEEYKTIIRSVQYKYQVSLDENGNPLEVSSDARTVYINLHDGQLLSETRERKIHLETKVALDIPNAFTPNGDRSNDTWRIRATNIDQLEDAVIRVYNRRGLLIYEAIGLKKEWDGISGGKVLPVDTYYYTIDLNLSYMKKTYKGVVTILH